MIDVTDLKPCPFCGGEPYCEPGPTHDHWIAGCSDCEVHIVSTLKNTVVANWQKRTIGNLMTEAVAAAKAETIENAANIVDRIAKVTRARAEQMKTANVAETWIADHMAWTLEAITLLIQLLDATAQTETERVRQLGRDDIIVDSETLNRTRGSNA